MTSKRSVYLHLDTQIAYALRTGDFPRSTLPLSLIGKHREAQATHDNSVRLPTVAVASHQTPEAPSAKTEHALGEESRA